MVVLYTHISQFMKQGGYSQCCGKGENIPSEVIAFWSIKENTVKSLNSSPPPKKGQPMEIKAKLQLCKPVLFN